MNVQLIPFSEEHKNGFIEWNQDADSLYRFAGTGFVFPLTLDQIAAYPQKHKAFAYALIDSEANHLANGDFVEDQLKEEVRLCRLIVNPKFRGLGYGKKLVNELELIGKLMFPNYKLSLNVLEDNEVAIQLYLKCGYRKTEEFFSFEAGGKVYKGFKMIHE